MEELLTGVNWLAVAVGGILSYILGWAWYSPKLFGKTWAKGVGISIATPDKMPVAAMLSQAIGTFLLAWIVGVTAAREELLTIILVVFTIVFLMIAGGHFSKKKSCAIAIEAGFIIAMAVIMIIAQGIF